MTAGVQWSVSICRGAGRADGSCSSSGCVRLQGSGGLCVSGADEGDRWCSVSVHNIQC